MKSHSSLLLLLFAAITLYGCVLPIPSHKVLAGTPVTEEQLAFIQLGETTKENVLARLGEPQIIWEDAHIFVYEWEVRHGILLWAVGAGYSGGFGATDLRTRYVLIIQFDGTGRLQRFERAVRPPLKSYGDFLREWVSQPRSNTLDGRQ
jgi:outer membrane protein assembly factor BamE (lipoprotein component of BamABCDE complex)